MRTRVAVSGTSGLIGSAVAAELGKMYDVVSIGRTSAPLEADFAEPTSFANLDLNGCMSVVHCAGVVDEDFREDPARAFRQATLGMAAFVRRAKECGVAHFAYVSSAHVYGPLEGKIDERRPPNPMSDYALAHFASEQILRRVTHGAFRGAAFRPCAVFGVPPNLTRFRRWALAPFEFPRDIVQTGKITLKSTGEQRRNFVAAKDIAKSIAFWLEDRSHAPHMSIINPLGNESMSIWQFAQLCASAGEELLEKPVILTRTQSAGEKCYDFDYESVHPQSPHRENLKDTIRQLIELLLEQASRRVR